MALEGDGQEKEKAEGKMRDAEENAGGKMRDAECGRMRYLYAGWAILETMLFGGLLNGWASLVFVLKEDGLYRNLCSSAPSDLNNLSDHGNVTTISPEDDEAGCLSQDSRLNLWFTISISVQNLFNIAVGLHMYRFGIKSARITGWFFFTIGALMMAFTDKSVPWLVLPSLVTLGYGGIALLLTNMTVSCLFPRAAGVYIALVSGAFDFSATTQLVVKVLNESGLSSRMYSYLGLCGLYAAMVLLSSLCFMPKATSTSHPTEEIITLEDSSNGYGVTSDNNMDTVRKDRIVVNGEENHGADDVKTDDGGTTTSEQPGGKSVKPKQQTLPVSVTGLDETLSQDVKGPKQRRTMKPEVRRTEDDGMVQGHCGEKEGLGDRSLQSVLLDVADLDNTEKIAGTTGGNPDECPDKKGGNRDELFPDLKSCVTSAVFWLHVLWHSCNMLRFLCFFGLINTKLTAMFHGDKDKVSYFTNVLAYFMLAVMAVCWISGAVYDWQFAVFKGRSSQFQRTILPAALPLAMTSLVGVALSVVWLIDSEMMIYFLFGLFVLYNAFIFGICYSFVHRVFPDRYFGIMSGLVFTMTGLFCLTQYGVFLWHESYEGSSLHADVFLLVLTVISLTHPAYLVIKGTCCDVTARQ